MEQLHLVGVHEHGEHLIVEGPDSTRFTLSIDQQLRQAVQHARKKSAPRRNGQAQFGPRDIQARFRSGATVEDIVAESGWEAERVKRYEWPILAERAHMIREACKVKVAGTGNSGDGYRSVFEVEPRTLLETVTARAEDAGVDSTTFDWDSWQREDQLWTIQLSFRVNRRSKAPLEGSGPAEWTFNPASQSLRPVNDWARALGEEPRESDPLGVPATVAAAQATTQNPVLQQLHQDAVRSDELLDVLQARRGRRLGTDTEGDDRLAEILGRGMGQVDSRPRPIDAPGDSPLFNHPIQPAAERVSEDQALQADAGIEIVDDSTYSQENEAHSPHNNGANVSSGASQEDPAVSTQVPGREAAAAVHHLSVNHTTSQGRNPVNESPDSSPFQPTSTSGVVPPSQNQATESPAYPQGGTETEQGTNDQPEQGADVDKDTQDSAAKTPGPRSRTPKGRRSSVPSWDDIVFGSNRS